MPQTAMSPCNQTTCNEQSRRWSKQNWFNGERYELRYEKSATSKALTWISTLDTFRKSIKLNWMKLQWYLPHHPVNNPHKPEKLRSVQHCSKVSRRSHQRQISTRTRSGVDPDRKYFLLREHQIAPSADIEAMFLQIAVPSDDNRCLQFLWWEDPEQKMEVYKYTRHVFGANSWSTCAI